MAKRSDAQGEVLRAVENIQDRSAIGRRGNPERKQAERVEALSLRLAGLTYAQIGERLGVSSRSAQTMVTTVLENAENRGADEMRNMENARLDRAQAAIWGQVLNGDIPAVNTFLSISNRRATLNGLNAPKRVDLAVSVKQEMEQALGELEEIVLGDEEVEDSGDEQ